MLSAGGITSQHVTFSAKGNMEVFKIKHHGPVRSRGCVGGDGQCCDFPKFFHLVEEPVAQISPAPGFVLCTYKEETSLAQKKPLAAGISLLQEFPIAQAQKPLCSGSPALTISVIFHLFL